MTLQLSITNLKKLDRGIQLLSSPLDLDSVDAWRSAVKIPPSAVGGVPALVRAAKYEVFTIEQAYGSEYPNYLRSVYYNEYVRPNGAHDASGMVVLTPTVSGAMDGSAAGR